MSLYDYLTNELPFQTMNIIADVAEVSMCLSELIKDNTPLLPGVYQGKMGTDTVYFAIQEKYGDLHCGPASEVSDNHYVWNKIPSKEELTPALEPQRLFSRHSFTTPRKIKKFGFVPLEYQRVWGAGFTQ